MPLMLSSRGISGMRSLCRSSDMLRLLAVLLLASVISATSILGEDSAVKNHRLEKRQDDFLFYGGWQPVKKGHSFGYSPSRYHDLLSGLPDNLDTSPSFYSHARQKSRPYTKDIYSYYPKPAIRPAPKKNTPVYMERYKPHFQKSQGSNLYNQAPQFLDIQKIDLSQIKELHNVLLQAKDLPLSQLSLGASSGKPFELLEVPSPKRHHGNRRKNGYGGRSRQSFSQGHYRAHSSQSASPFEYLSLPAIHGHSFGHQSKNVEVSPINLPHPNIDIKNIQFVEVEVPSGLKFGANNKYNHVPSFGRVANKAQYQPRRPQQYASQKVSFPASDYHVQQPKPHYSSSISHHVKENSLKEEQLHEIEAELIKLSDDQINHLLKSLHVVSKGLPLEQLKKTKDENVEIILAVPQLNGQAGPAYNLEQQSSYNGDSNGYSEDNRQQIAYSSQDSNDYSQNSHEGGISYQTQEHTYQGGQSEYHGQKSADSGYQQPSGSHQHDGQTYIEVINAEADEDGYRREPVLAVELKHGQTIEEAIQSLDPETLHKIGAHGQNGLEIEVVEVPLEEYSSESKKSEVVVPSGNSTTTPPPKTSTTKVAKGKKAT